MSKRKALVQGRKETGLDDDREEKMSENEGNVRRATAAQLAARKIAAPRSARGRIAAAGSTANRPAGSPQLVQPNANPFGSLDPNAVNSGGIGQQENSLSSFTFGQTATNQQQRANGNLFGQAQSQSFPQTNSNSIFATQNGGTNSFGGFGSGGSSSFNFNVPSSASFQFPQNQQTGTDNGIFGSNGINTQPNSGGFSGFQGSLFKIPTFGSAPSTVTTGAPTSLFGAPTTTAPASSNPFAASTPNPSATSNPFGASKQSQPQDAAKASSPLFGTQNSFTSPNLFGLKPNTNANSYSQAQNFGTNPTTAGTPALSIPQETPKPFASLFSTPVTGPAPTSNLFGIKPITEAPSSSQPQTSNTESTAAEAPVASNSQDTPKPFSSLFGTPAIGAAPPNNLFGVSKPDSTPPVNPSAPSKEPQSQASQSKDNLKPSNIFGTPAPGAAPFGNLFGAPKPHPTPTTKPTALLTEPQSSDSHLEESPSKDTSKPLSYSFGTQNNQSTIPNLFGISPTLAREASPAEPPTSSVESSTTTEYKASYGDKMQPYDDQGNNYPSDIFPQKYVREPHDRVTDSPATNPLFDPKRVTQAAEPSNETATSSPADSPRQTPTSPISVAQTMSSQSGEFPRQTPPAPNPLFDLSRVKAPGAFNQATSSSSTQAPASRSGESSLAQAKSAPPPARAKTEQEQAEAYEVTLQKYERMVRRIQLEQAFKRKIATVDPITHTFDAIIAVLVAKRAEMGEPIDLALGRRSPRSMAGTKRKPQDNDKESDDEDTEGGRGKGKRPRTNGTTPSQAAKPIQPPASSFAGNSTGTTPSNNFPTENTSNESVFSQTNQQTQRPTFNFGGNQAAALPSSNSTFGTANDIGVSDHTNKRKFAEDWEEPPSSRPRTLPVPSIAVNSSTTAPSNSSMFANFFKDMVAKDVRGQGSPETPKPTEPMPHLRLTGPEVPSPAETPNPAESSNGLFGRVSTPVDGNSTQEEDESDNENSLFIGKPSRKHLSAAVNSGASTPSVLDDREAFDPRVPQAWNIFGNVTPDPDSAAGSKAGDADNEEESEGSYDPSNSQGSNYSDRNNYSGSAGSDSQRDVEPTSELLQFQDTESAGSDSQADAGPVSGRIQPREFGSASSDHQGKTGSASGFLQPQNTKSAVSDSQENADPASELSQTQDTGSDNTNQQGEAGSASPPLKQVDFSDAPEGGNEDTIFRTNATAYWFGAIPDATEGKNPDHGDGGLRHSGAPQWNVRGRGVLRVLQDRNTGKCRILLRQAPTGRIVLNTPLIDSFKYGNTQPKMVSIGIAKSGTEVETWAIKPLPPDATTATELANLLEQKKAN